MAATTDVMLFGPTGVTGREVARHLARRAPELGLTWGVAGRDRGRIDDVLRSISATPDAVVVADSTDAASIEAMVTSTKVVANLVGPYARYGEPVYEACARLGRTQLDLTGEVDWVADMIAEYHDDAVASGARIIPTAGFEGLPFDLGALLAARTAHERSGAPVVEVDVAVSMTNSPRVSGASDAVSGGTFVSGVEALRRGSGRAFTDPHLLDPAGAAHDTTYDLRPRRHPGTGQWLGPMVPSPFINPPMVHRGAAQLRARHDDVYAEEFRYREGMAAGGSVPGPFGAASAAAMSAFQVGFGLTARAPGIIRKPFADTLLRFGPKAGEGPPEDQLDAWSYRLDIRATAADGTTADVRVDADGHPGYKSTATMVGEAALILADESAPVPEATGFLTPASAIGSEVLDRFAHAGARFTVVG